MDETCPLCTGGRGGGGAHARGARRPAVVPRRARPSAAVPRRARPSGRQPRAGASARGGAAEGRRRGRGGSAARRTPASRGALTESGRPEVDIRICVFGGRCEARGSGDRGGAGRCRVQPRQRIRSPKNKEQRARGQSCISAPEGCISAPEGGGAAPEGGGAGGPGTLLFPLPGSAAGRGGGGACGGWMADLRAPKRVRLVRGEGRGVSD